MKSKTLIPAVIAILFFLLIVFLGLIFLNNSNRLDLENKNNIENNTLDSETPEPLPEGVEPFSSHSDVTSTAELIPELSLFVTAVKSSPLISDLQDENRKFTVFIPLDSAISDKPLSSLTSEELSAVLSTHISDKYFSSNELLEGTKIPTLSGIDLEIIRDSEGFLEIKGSNNTAKILTVDLVSSNGVIHIIDNLLTP